MNDVDTVEKPEASLPEETLRKLDECTLRETLQLSARLIEELKAKGEADEKIANLVRRVVGQALRREAKKFFAVRFPLLLIDLFQGFLIIEKLFGLMPFGGMSWLAIMSPTVISIVCGVVFMTPEERDRILEEARRRRGK